MEADFLREYGIDLAADLAGMSWRRFLVLLRGLSPQSAAVTAAAGRDTIGGGDRGGDRAVTVQGAANVDAAFAALFSGGRRRAPEADRVG